MESIRSAVCAVGGVEDAEKLRERERGMASKVGGREEVPNENEAGEGLLVWEAEPYDLFVP